MLKSYAMTVVVAEASDAEPTSSSPLETIPEELDSLTSQLSKTRISSAEMQEEVSLVTDAQLDQLQALLDRIKVL